MTDPDPHLPSLSTRRPAVAWALMPPALGIFGSSSPPEIALIIAFLILSLSLHEVGHAWVAWMRGDSTAKELGRLSLNPIVHIDLFMTILLPAILAYTGGIIFGGAKPVPVNANRLKHPLRDMMLVAIAGPAVNLLLAFVFFFARSAALDSGYTDDMLLIRVLEISGVLNVLLAVFNLLPIPPLDGSRVMAWLLPPPMRHSYAQLERWGLLIVIFVVFFVPPVWNAVGTAIYEVSYWINDHSYLNPQPLRIFR